MMKNGEIIIGDLAINNVLTKTAFFISEISKNAKLKIENGDYASYEIDSATIRGEKFNMSLYFFKDQITEIDLYILLSNETSSWEKWSREDEVKRKLKQEKWMANNCIISGSTASWGSVHSIFDDKAGFSYIRIKYITNSVA